MRTPELCSVSHTPRRPNHSTARSRDWTPRKSSPNGSEASTAKRNCPAWRRSSSPIAFSIVRMATDGSARLTDQWSVNRCRNQRFQAIIVSPAPGGAASAEPTAAAAEPAPAETSAAEAASARPAAAGPSPARPAAATAHSVDERDDKADQPPEDRKHERARHGPDDRADDRAGDPSSDDSAEHALQECVRRDECDEQP